MGSLSKKSKSKNSSAAPAATEDGGSLQEGVVELPLVFACEKEVRSGEERSDELRRRVTCVTSMLRTPLPFLTA